MILGALYRADSSECLVPRVSKTSTMFERMRGLLGRPPLQSGEGLLIVPCPSVHTIGMRYALDLLFLDTRGMVLHAVASLPPMRMAACPRAHATVELPAGTLATLAVTVGDVLQWRAA